MHMINTAACYDLEDSSQAWDRVPLSDRKQVRDVPHAIREPCLQAVPR